MNQQSVLVRPMAGASSSDDGQPTTYLVSQSFGSAPFRSGLALGGLINRRLVRFTASKGPATDGRDVTDRSNRYGREPPLLDASSNVQSLTSQLQTRSH